MERVQTRYLVYGYRSAPDKLDIQFPTFLGSPRFRETLIPCLRLFLLQQRSANKRGGKTVDEIIISSLVDCDLRDKHKKIFKIVENLHFQADTEKFNSKHSSMTN